MRTALIEARTLAAQPTAVRRAVLRPSEVDGWISETLCDLAESLRRGWIVPNGFPFSRRHRTPGGWIAVEAGFPLPLPIVTSGRMQSSSLPAGPVAVTTHDGHYQTIGTAYDVLADWLDRHQVQPVGDPWEVYHSPPIGSPDEWHTELVQPYSVASGNKTSAIGRRGVAGTSGP